MTNPQVAKGPDAQDGGDHYKRDGAQDPPSCVKPMADEAGFCHHMDRSGERRALADYIELRSGRSARLVTLERERVTIGRSSTNDIALPEDGQVSRMHAVLERLPAGWYV